MTLFRFLYPHHKVQSFHSVFNLFIFLFFYLEKQSPLRRLDAIATERGCDYSWLEQCTNVGWRIQLSLSLKGKKPIIIEDTSESKLQAKNSCANMMLSYLGRLLKESNQNVQSTIELNSSTISLITTSSTSL